MKVIHIFIFGLLLFCIGCDDSESKNETKKLFINSKLADCVGVMPQKCLQVKENKSDEWSFLYDEIEDFTFEEGFTYEIIVETIDIENPPADGSSIKYKLIEIVSKEPDNRIFNTSLNFFDNSGNERLIFLQGETIEFTINFTNLTSETQTMGFSSSQKYDIQVYSSDDTLIWNWAYDKAFSQALTELVFSANETKHFEETWNQETNEGLQLDAGNYSVYVNSAGPYFIEIE